MGISSPPTLHFNSFCTAYVELRLQSLASVLKTIAYFSSMNSNIYISACIVTFLVSSFNYDVHHGWFAMASLPFHLMFSSKCIADDLGV